MISVITATYDPEPDYLMAAWESVRTQQLPESWTLQWVVQEDGRQARAARDILPAHPLIHLESGRRGGVAITRNLGLARSGGELVKTLDQDDILTPGALARDIAVLTQHPHVGWVTSPALDLLPDDSTRAAPSPYAPGAIPAGELVRYWRDNNHYLAVHPATMCLRRTLAVAVGGWMAVPGSDDTGLLIAASVIAAGWLLERPGLLYRRWDGQVSAPGSPHYEPVERGHRMRLISDRADALAALGWAPLPVG